MHNNQNNHVTGQHARDERRRQIASLLAQSRTETEIAEMLGVDQGTVSRDVKALRESAKQFVFDMAKSDLVYFYRTCIDGIDAVKLRAWDAANRLEREGDDKTMLLALKLCKECDEARFGLFQSGPNVLKLDRLEAQADKIELEERNLNIYSS